MRLKLAHGLTIKASPIDGKGCFATRLFPRGRKIAEYEGERIASREARRRAGRRKLRICEVDERWSIDGSRGGNGTHYINHSCRPNCYMKILYGHVLFFSLRDIHPGEEITLDYVSTLHSDKKRCTCGALDCRGTINLVKGEGEKSGPD
ncbi:MAG TPA: SET domain-containing protein-lysine N-methyltransferase [Pyrinomonadaceae bacterium]|nr:SET domain-containing protein-lysine N-methyltransferase [Pyrinomonadaceae bacterium]